MIFEVRLEVSYEISKTLVNPNQIIGESKLD